MMRPIILAIAAVLLLVVAIRFEWLGGAIFTEATGAVRGYYTALLQAGDEWVDTYFDQADTIESLMAENRLLKEDRETLSAFAAEVISLSKFKSYEYSPSFRVRTVRAISYAELPDLQKIIIDYGALEPNEVKGLIYNNQTAGIVVEPVGSRSKALLNGDSQCSYSVYIGETKAPGIAMGKNDQEMIVRYIPAWMNIAEGDEVVTNGLDGIFFAGVKVGVVTKVNRLNAYIEAIVKPYYTAFSPDYFYLVESAR
ncbi:hypothetical protein AGMMS49521_3950 [Campylobacterota bacterium]|nr:hypothetical protein AGMMS49521_3950 [Campylobacterota bacterium]GHV04139.1 hypothetical protein AGMMS50229_04840 [Campylobacterota bacterium]